MTTPGTSSTFSPGVAAWTEGCASLREVVAAAGSVGWAFAFAMAGWVCFLFLIFSVAWVAWDLRDGEFNSVSRALFIPAAISTVGAIAQAIGRRPRLTAP